MSVVLRMYFNITPGKYEEASKLMKQLQDLSKKYGLPEGRVLSGHFVSPGQPNWQWESEFATTAEAIAYLDKFDDMPEMEKIGPATYGVWNQQGVEVYHVVEFD